jgi:hypothetical protein
MDNQEKLEEALSAFIAQQQNEIDHIVRKVYGNNIKFEQLSPLGQYTVESMARNSRYPELPRSLVMPTSSYDAESSERIAALLRENQDLHDENEILRQELEDYENSDRGRSGRREE